MNGMIPTGWDGNWEYTAYAYVLTTIVLVGYTVSLVLRARTATR